VGASHQVHGQPARRHLRLGEDDRQGGA